MPNYLEKTRHYPTLPLCLYSQKSRGDLGGASQLINTSDRQHILELIEEGKRLGLCAEKACEAIGITSRAIRKWRSHKDPLVDGRTKEGRKDTPRKAPANSLTPEEKAALIKRYSEPDVVNLPLNQAFYRVLDSGQYFGSLSTVYRVMNEAGLNKNRNSTRASCRRVQAYEL